eukprot:CAMPEP_0194284480 /NCGR_PEP_ID=MMETSP0169-20130528/27701_1 /TAXON_ID=218684 /ORGANISM="Corethron pennatum, Strain L29A3" /LENGTH=183 /DNA_ID=CAMNT_0039030307 /DNA_START=41 /DNA_END=590 /DNA_ORIENTATION=+
MAKDILDEWAAGAKKAGSTFMRDVAAAKEKQRDKLLAAKAKNAKAAAKAEKQYLEMDEDQKAAAIAKHAEKERKNEIMAKEIADEWTGLKAEALAWFAARKPAGKAKSLADLCNGGRWLTEDGQAAVVVWEVGAPVRQTARVPDVDGEGCRDLGHDARTLILCGKAQGEGMRNACRHGVSHEG